MSTNVATGAVKPAVTNSSDEKLQAVNEQIKAALNTVIDNENARSPHVRSDFLIASLDRLNTALTLDMQKTMRQIQGKPAPEAIDSIEITEVERRQREVDELKYKYVKDEHYFSRAQLGGLIKRKQYPGVDTEIPEACDVFDWHHGLKEATPEINAILDKHNADKIKASMPAAPAQQRSTTPQPQTAPKTKNASNIDAGMSQNAILDQMSAIADAANSKIDEEALKKAYGNVMQAFFERKISSREDLFIEIGKAIASCMELPEGVSIDINTFGHFLDNLFAGSMSPAEISAGFNGSMIQYVPYHQPPHPAPQVNMQYPQPAPQVNMQYPQPVPQVNIPLFQSANAQDVLPLNSALPAAIPDPETTPIHIETTPDMDKKRMGIKPEVVTEPEADVVTQLSTEESNDSKIDNSRIIERFGFLQDLIDMASNYDHELAIVPTYNKNTGAPSGLLDVYVYDETGMAINPFKSFVIDTGVTIDRQVKVILNLHANSIGYEMEENMYAFYDKSQSKGVRRKLNWELFNVIFTIGCEEVPKAKVRGLFSKDYMTLNKIVALISVNGTNNSNETKKATINRLMSAMKTPVTENGDSLFADILKQYPQTRFSIAGRIGKDGSTFKLNSGGVPIHYNGDIYSATRIEVDFSDDGKATYKVFQS